MQKSTDQYDKLIAHISQLVQQSKQQVVKQINTIITHTYWQIGRYIVEYEQNGNERAEYGTSLLSNLSQDLTQQFGKGYSYRNLQLAKKFYITFPIMQSVIAQSESKKNAFEKALLNCSWTNLVRLLSIKDETERSFYLIETVANNWTVRELNRQINVALFERLLLSKDKTKIKQIAKEGQKLNKTTDVLKDPYIFEFLDIDVNSSFSENDLEKAVINNLEKFLLELGKGFSFVARQYRILSGADHFYIDLVFYNRLLKSHVLIDLKIGELKHQDIGQMQMYVNYFDREIETENPTIGIILCKEKNDFVVEYSLPDNNQQIYSKEYLLYLPKKEELKQLLKGIYI